MHTVHQPPVSGEPPGAAATPYFARDTAISEAVERAETWYRGGPDPLSLAAEQAETWYAGGLPPDRFAA